MNLKFIEIWHLIKIKGISFFLKLEKSYFISASELDVQFRNWEISHIGRNQICCVFWWIEDPKIFIEDPKMFIEDPKIFIEDPRFSSETPIFTSKISNMSWSGKSPMKTFWVVYYCCFYFFVSSSKWKRRKNYVLYKVKLWSKVTVLWDKDRTVIRYYFKDYDFFPGSLLQRLWFLPRLIITH